MSKSEMMTELARERGWLIKEIKLVNGGPEFEVVHKAPTYEQAVVHMYREAQSIIAQGTFLKNVMYIARRDYLYESQALRVRRALKIEPPSYAAKAHLTNKGQQRVCEALDKLWEAQEKYNTWAKLYGDI